MLYYMWEHECIKRKNTAFFTVDKLQFLLKSIHTPTASHHGSFSAKSLKGDTALHQGYTCSILLRIVTYDI
jgi:hypothetical protein